MFASHVFSSFLTFLWAFCLAFALKRRPFFHVTNIQDISTHPSRANEILVRFRFFALGLIEIILDWFSKTLGD